MGCGKSSWALEEKEEYERERNEYIKRNTYNPTMDDLLLIRRIKHLNSSLSTYIDNMEENAYNNLEHGNNQIQGTLKILERCKITTEDIGNELETLKEKITISHI